MSFFLGQKVASVKNASHVGVVLEIGLPNERGVHWVRVRYGKKGQGKWTLADGVRPYQSSRSIPVPDGVVVLIRPGHAPEVFQQPRSEATEEECRAFLSAIQRMFLSKGRKSMV
jgi:hypothetical protein